MRPIPVNSVEAPFGLEPTEAPLRNEPGPNFGGELERAIQGVGQVQLAADAEAQKVALGGGNLHELSLALEKADVAMRVATKVRNKLIDAYHEIMRMGV